MKTISFLFVALASLVAVCITFVALPEAAHAGAPMAKSQAPGFYRLMLGDFEVTALSDGTLDLPADGLLAHTTPEKVKKGLAKSFQTTPVETSVNAFLVNTGDKLILIDVGSAGLFGPTLGKLATNLVASGYKPEQIDEIYITHMHPDHVGGLMDADKLAFPNAVVRAQRRDADFWLSETNAAKAAKGTQDFFKGAVTSVNPYIAAGRFKPFDGDSELAPGIKVKSTFGHTPGHTSYSVESRGQRLVLWGDLLHVEAIQFGSPEVTILFDSTPADAASQRRRMLGDAERAGYLVGAAHIAFPGIGHVRKDGAAYRWVPVNYTIPR